MAVVVERLFDNRCSMAPILSGDPNGAAISTAQEAVLCKPVFGGIPGRWSAILVRNCNSAPNDVTASNASLFLIFDHSFPPHDASFCGSVSNDGLSCQWAWLCTLHWLRRQRRGVHAAAHRDAERRAELPAAALPGEPGQPAAAGPAAGRAPRWHLVRRQPPRAPARQQRAPAGDLVHGPALATRLWAPDKPSDWAARPVAFST